MEMFGMRLPRFGQIALWCFCGMALLCGLPAYAANSVAILTNYTGNVQFHSVHGTGWRGATLLEELREGDCLQTGPSASAVLIFRDNHLEVLTAGTFAVLHPEGCGIAVGAKASRPAPPRWIAVTY